MIVAPRSGGTSDVTHASTYSRIADFTVQLASGANRQ